MEIGLFFGSFNPIHIGHMAIANFALEYTPIDQLWFIVSPQNPFKNKAGLLQEYHRLELVNRAIDKDSRLRASAIEFNLPQPSYTIDTIIHLKEQYPQHSFRLLMGADQLASFHKWKNPDILRQEIKFLVYPRPGARDPKQLLKEPEFSSIEAPLMEISSSFIRKAIAEGKDLQHYLPLKAWEYLDEMGFYKK